MRRSDWNRESDYQRRLRISTPIAAVLIGALFLATEHVPTSVLQFQFGWQGPTRVLPEITLLPDVDLYEDLREQSRRRLMTALDIEALEERGDTPAPKPTVEQPKPVDRPEDVVTPNIAEQQARHYPAHTSVPYSEEYVILHMVRPEYPPEELKEGVEGDVTVELYIDDGGTVESAWVLMATGPPSFEHASLDAVRQFRFKPPLMQGKPMPMWIRFQIRFRIMS
jgi:TonB family protein